ncbi:MAG: PLP-dependent aminotransferase family protein [Candidatus Zixiibacteriota bacterium]
MFNWPFSKLATSLEASVIRETLKISGKPGTINFAGGLPASDLLPVDQIAECVDNVLTDHAAQALQYSISQGVPVLRELIAQRISRQGLPVSADNILITTGSQQGLDLIGRVFIEPGDYVITESPTYLGALQAFNFYQCRYAPILMDDDGMIIDQLEEKIIKYRPKMIYVVPNFQNPSGITMSYQRRKALMNLVYQHQIALIDDNPYGELRYSGTPLPSLRGLGGDAVIQLGTFSKLISPGLRIGWICAPVSAIEIIEKAKQAVDLHSSTFTQFIAAEFMKRGYLDPHIEQIRTAYALKRDTMIAAMKEHFPPSVRWPHPDGGLFLWVQLPDHVSSRLVFQQALHAGVAFIYGRPFHPDGAGDNTLRLNFASSSPEIIIEGIKRLGGVLQQYC